MRILTCIFLGLLIASSPAFSQKKGNKMNGLSETKSTKKKYNKQWIRTSAAMMPKFSFTLGAAAGPATFSHDEPDLIELSPFTLISAPELTINFNPFKSFGFNLGIGHRSTSFAYRTSGAFANDSINATANGTWKHKFGNLGLSLGFTYYKGLVKKVASCSGFGLIHGSALHLYFQNSIILAPSIINELEFKGNYTKFVDGVLREEVNYGTNDIVVTDEPRRETMMFYSARLGLRFQADNYASRIGLALDYQLNDNTGLVNDFTTSTTSIMMVGVNIAFEFF